MATEKTDSQVIEECVKFLRESSTHYRPFVQRRIRAMEMYSGNFWNDGLVKTWRRKKRAKEHFSNWGVLANAISSPYSASPWHVELDERNDDLQGRIDRFEQDNDVKSACMTSFLNDVITGSGFAVVTTNEDFVTGEIVPTLESVQDVSSVALDPNITTLSGHDAEAGAIVNYISLARARREYGDDVVPMGYPKVQPMLSDFGEQWETHPENSVAIVSYFVKDDSGNVVCYRICGDRVVKRDTLPTNIIPIVRFAGYPVMEGGKIDYIGIVDKTYALQLGINLGYSTLLERMNRAPRANFICNVDAITGLERYYQEMNSDESLVALYKGDKVPQPIVESYQTADLVQTIESARNLMSDVVGVPLAGIQGINNTDTKTATEVLQQQINAESNVANFYHAAYEANMTIGRIVTQLLSGGERHRFKLENGPDVITRQMKRRQELATIATLVPENMKPILAKHYADTLDSDFADKLSADIVANMDVNLKLVSEKPVDPNAVHTINQLQALCEQMKQKLEEVMADNAEKQKEIDSLNLTMMNERESRQQAWEQFKIQEKDKVALETAKLQQSGTVDAMKLQLQQQQQALDADAKIRQLQVENDKAVAEVIKDEV